jgi:hypothetical protein
VLIGPESDPKSGPLWMPKLGKFSQHRSGSAKMHFAYAAVLHVQYGVSVKSGIAIRGNGSVSLTAVPVRSDRIWSDPPRSVKRSRIPARPTPTSPVRSCRRHNRSGGIPCPLSLISNRTCLASCVIKISTTELTACLCMFVRHSCTRGIKRFQQVDGAE